MKNRAYDAVIFDLDGVLTQTEKIHFLAWKEMFETHFKQSGLWADSKAEFTYEKDYLPYVDGRPRYEGVATFLSARGIELPFGTPRDRIEMDTVCGLGNRKNHFFQQVLREKGVEVYPMAMQLVKNLAKAGIPMAIASSSKNGRRVVECAGIQDYFSVIVDGNSLVELQLAGKPDPAIFLETARQLAVPPERVLVIEDAVAGVKAGKRGGFGMVLGLARQANFAALKEAGADWVLPDLEPVNAKTINDKLVALADDSGWNLIYPQFLPNQWKSIETLLVTGNGLFCTRGTMPEIANPSIQYPATYRAGLYNEVLSGPEKSPFPQSELVKLPNWLPMSFRIGQEKWFNLEDFECLEIYHQLNFRSGLLTRKMRVKDPNGRISRIETERFTSMSRPHMMALRYSLVPENYAARLSFRSMLDGDVKNAGVSRYPVSDHLDQIAAQGQDVDLFLSCKTKQSNHIINIWAHHMIKYGGERISPQITHSSTTDSAELQFEIQLQKNSRLSIEKLVEINLSDATDNPVNINQDKTTNTNWCDFDHLLNGSKHYWNRLWQQWDIRIHGHPKAQQYIRLHTYHLLCTIARARQAEPVGWPARGWHGEAYRGHVFWDEMFMFPLVVSKSPGHALHGLQYRCLRMATAKQNATSNKHRGLLFPWQSAASGCEETPPLHLNPLSENWDPDNSALQYHVNLAIAKNVLVYFEQTQDVKFMSQCGVEILIGVARFWLDLADKQAGSQVYCLNHLMGPDEFHERYPGVEKAGINNNAYTNIMVAHLFIKINQLKERLPDWEQLVKRLAIGKEELQAMQHIATRLPLHLNKDGVLEQFDGYFKLQELDWVAYQDRYGSVERLDRILKAEHLSPDRFQVAKQADVLMLWYLFPDAELRKLLAAMGYNPPENWLRKNYKFYQKRTSHGSTLSRLVFSKVAFEAGQLQEAWSYFWGALQSDVADSQGGTTAEGIHLGVMAGTIWLVQSMWAGISIHDQRIVINPRLPAGWTSIELKLIYRGHSVAVKASNQDVLVELLNGAASQIFEIGNQHFRLSAGESKRVEIQ